jgi:hypothetical protein
MAINIVPKNGDDEVRIDRFGGVGVRQKEAAKAYLCVYAGSSG